MCLVEGGGREMYHPRHIPCFHCHPHGYIRMVQHLIERCLLFRMDRNECITVLAKHASIQPLIILTVWRELVKENKGFFQAYFHQISPRHYTYKRQKRAMSFGRRQMWTQCQGMANKKGF